MRLRVPAIILIIGLVFLGAVVTLPVWGMGPAIFLDMERAILSRRASPNGDRIASVERVVLGGEPTIVVIVRDRWVPSWYATGCVVSAHYQDAHARIEWSSEDTLTVVTNDGSRFWDSKYAPFHPGNCQDVSAVFKIAES